MYGDHKFFSEDRKPNVKNQNNLIFESTMMKNFPAAEISRNIYRKRSKLATKKDFMNNSIDVSMNTRKNGPQTNAKIKYVDHFPQNTDLSIDCGDLSSLTSIDKKMPFNSLI